MEDYEKYRMQKVHAKSRSIEFNLTFEEWLSWWKSTGKYHLRGKRSDEYCMCRKGDTGAYSLDNIYCATNLQNAIDAKANGKLKPTAGFKGRKHSEVTKKLISEKLKDQRIDFELQVLRKTVYDSIDFSKRGSLGKFATAIGVSHTQARRFINKYL